MYEKIEHLFSQTKKSAKDKWPGGVEHDFKNIGK